MDQIQTLSNAVSQALAENTLYSTYEPQWRYLLESYMGGDEYRRAENLVRYQLEQDNEYNNRLYNTPLDNQCASVISVYQSFLFRTPPERQFGSIENMPEVEEFLADADQDGQGLDQFMKDASTYASIFGTCWIMVTKPYVGAVTMAEELAAGVRPYVSLLTPLVVTDWEWQRSPTGRYELSYFKYLEEVTGNTKVVKEWYPWEVYTRIVDTENDIILEETVEKNGLGKIPAVCLYNKRGVVRGIGISDIQDIADHQRYIYNCYSEILQSIQMDTHPSLVATPETNVGTGSGALIHIPENIDPALKPYLLEFSGAGIDKILSSISASISAIEKMANIGAVRSTEARRMSGVAQQQEFELLNAKLSEKADNIELAEEQIWRLWCEYMGRVWDGVVDYPGSFNIRDTETEINQLKVAADIVGDDPVARQEIVGRVLEYLGVEMPTAQEASVPGRTYPDGEPIDPRLPDAYQKWDSETGEKCYNCQFYTEDGLCTAWDMAVVRPKYWCARWAPIIIATDGSES